MEKDKKNKVLSERRSRLSDRAGKTRTALLEMCTAPQGTRTAKSMLINDRMQNPVFSKTVDGSEHSESKFCYSSELSDAELLRSPTRSESTERKSTLLTNEEVHNFLMIRNQQQANRRSSKTTFPDELSNNYITFGISKQTLQAKLLSV